LVVVVASAARHQSSALTLDAMPTLVSGSRPAVSGSVSGSRPAARYKQITLRHSPVSFDQQALVFCSLFRAYVAYSVFRPVWRVVDISESVNCT